MPASSRFPIEHISHSAELRRRAIRFAEELGFNEVRAGQVGIVATEAATNILNHARNGEILLQVSDPGIPQSVPDLEILALDRGPGMDIEKCLQDGFSTGSTPGQGLGAIQRLSDESDFYSKAGEGTAVLARWVGTRTSAAGQRDGNFVRFGAVNVPKNGEEVCGDAWGIERAGAITTVMLADGLGHGYEASRASVEATRILRQNSSLLPGALIDITHRALRSLRGAAVSIARLDPLTGTVCFTGLGNVSCQIYSPSGRSQHLVSVNGTAGHQAARIREFSYAWPADGILIMHSDGLTTGTSIEAKPGLAFRDVSLIAGVLYRDFSRGHDDATIVVGKAA